MRRKRAGEDATRENELLILSRTTHAVVVGGSDDHPGLLAFGRRTDQVPTVRAHLLLNLGRRLSHEFAATRVRVLLSLRSRRDRHAGPVPRLEVSGIQPQTRSRLGPGRNAQHECDGCKRQNRPTLSDAAKRGVELCGSSGCERQGTYIFTAEIGRKITPWPRAAYAVRRQTGPRPEAA